MSPFHLLQDILQAHRRARFVGREDCLHVFREALDLPPDDERKRFVLHIQGAPGMGTTRLLQRFQEIALRRGALTAWVYGEQVHGILEALQALAKGLEQQGAGLPHFRELFALYQKLRRLVRADPQAPLGLPMFFYHYLLNHWWPAARQSTLGYVLEKVVDDGRPLLAPLSLIHYLARKVPDERKRGLLLEPVAYLTRAFLADLLELSQNTLVVLFFDDYDMIEDVLTPWLQDVFEGRYGPVSLQVLWVLGGKRPLDEVRWAPYEPILARLVLQPFSEAEIRHYLLRQGIQNPQAIRIIQNLSQGKPLWVSALAEFVPPSEEALGTMAGHPLERLLQWLSSEQQEYLLLAAIPRTIDEENLGVLAGSEKAGTILRWLQNRSFTHPQNGSWVFNKEFRQALLRYWRTHNVKRFLELNEQLRAYYAERQKRRLEEAHPRDEQYQQLTLQELYHRLVAFPDTALTYAVDGFFQALETDMEWAYQWATVLSDVGWDIESWNLHKWGQNLRRIYHAFAREAFRDAVEALTLVVNMAEPITRHTRAMAYAYRGLCYFLLHEAEKALSDLAEALKWEAKNPWIRERRAVVYLMERSYPQALKDFMVLVEEQPSAWTSFALGCAYFLMEQYDLAITQFQQAIRDPDVGPWALAMRGEVYRHQGLEAEALQDLEKAQQALPDSIWIRNRCGLARLRLGQFHKAVQDFDKVLEYDPQNAWALANRGLAFEMLGQFPRALDDFSKALTYKPDFVWALARRGELYMLLGQYSRALEDFNRALRINPNYAWARALRALLWALQKQFDKAQQDIQRVLQQHPNNDWYHYYRGLIALIQGNEEDAKKSIEHAIYLAQQHLQMRKVQPHIGLLNLMVYHAALGQIPQAEAHLRQALEYQQQPFFLRLTQHQLELLLQHRPGHSDLQRFYHKFLGVLSRVEVLQSSVSRSSAPEEGTEGPPDTNT